MESIDKGLIQINLTSLSIEPENDYNLSQYLDLEVTCAHKSVLMLHKGEDYPGLSSMVPYYLRNRYYIAMFQQLNELVLNINNDPVIINRDHISTMMKLSGTEEVCVNNLVITRDYFNCILICIDPSIYKVKFRLNKEIINKYKLRIHYTFDRLAECNSCILGVNNFLNENKDRLMTTQCNDDVEAKVPLKAVQSLYLATTAINHRADQIANLFDLLINEYCNHIEVNIFTSNYDVYVFWTDDYWHRRRNNELTPDTEVLVLFCKK